MVAPLNLRYAARATPIELPMLSVCPAGFADIKANQTRLLRAQAVQAATAPTTAGNSLLDLSSNFAAYKNRLAGVPISPPLLNAPGNQIHSYRNVFVVNKLLPPQSSSIKSGCVQSEALAT